ncbi:glycoside hydrolase family 61 protein [Xylariomycetidae sp. FL0641]|nr:glycoside hydrolase family 61 protein [Xylariomycetidae sp. FL0641]
MGPHLLAVAALAVVASAHTIFCQLEYDNKNYGVSYAIRTPSYDGPQTDVSSNYMACNGGSNPTTPSSKIIQVKAGSDVKAIWRKTLDTKTARAGTDDVIDSSHKGPTIAYLRKVSDATQDSGVGDGWFKIQEDGLSSGKWGTENLISNAGEQTIHIPDCIEDGQYLLRAELIALHGASSPGGAQFYMECAQIEVTGGKASKKPATVSIPGAYKKNDPGVVINIYQNLNSYQVPGPDVFTC